MVVMFYEATMSNELVNAETLPHWGSTELGCCEPLVTSIHDLVLYEFLFKDPYI